MNLYGMVGNSAVNRWDYLGLIDINFNPQGVNSRGKDKGCMSEFAKNAPDSESDMTVFGHGSPNAIRNNRNPEKPVDWGGDAGVEALVKEIKENQDWKDGKIKRIVLYACSTGQSKNRNGKKSFAQKLADKLDIPVLAPNEILWCSSDGTSNVCCLKPSVYVKIRKPDPNKPGDWMKFEKDQKPVIGKPPSNEDAKEAPKTPSVD